MTELITFITSPALAWRILPSLENKQAGLVSLLCNTLTAYVRNVSLEDIYLPVLLRACESMGRFLQQRYETDIRKLSPLHIFLLFRHFFLLIYTE